MFGRIFGKISGEEILRELQGLEIEYRELMESDGGYILWETDEGSGLSKRFQKELREAFKDHKKGNIHLSFQMLLSLKETMGKLAYIAGIGL